MERDFCINSPVDDHNSSSDSIHNPVYFSDKSELDEPIVTPYIDPPQIPLNLLLVLVSILAALYVLNFFGILT